MSEASLRDLLALVEEASHAYPVAFGLDATKRRDIARLWLKHLGNFDPRVLAMALDCHVQHSEWWPSVAKLREQAAELERDLVEKGAAMAAKQNPPPADVAGFKDAEGTIHRLERHYKTNKPLRDHETAFFYRVDGLTLKLPRTRWGFVTWLTAKELPEPPQDRRHQVVYDLDELRKKLRAKAL